MQVRTYHDAEEVAAAAADIVTAEIRSGARTLVLAGGSTPRRCYQLLAEEEVEWGRLTILFGDERCVPPDDPQSNYLMAREALLDRVTPMSVHRMPGELGPDAAAALYEPVVAALRPLDLVLLGLGPDGHTASLFPGHQSLQEDKRLVLPVRGAPKPPPDRVTLGLATLREARRILFLVSGRDKADAVSRARKGQVPASMVFRADWLIDRAAAGENGSTEDGADEDE